MTEYRAQDVALELTAGGCLKLSLEPSAQSASFYVFSLEHSGNVQFWQLLTRLMEVAKRPLCTLHGPLAPETHWNEVAQPAMKRLLCRDGYGFGIFFGANPIFDWIPEDRPKLFFLRDPRFMLQSSYSNLRRRADPASQPTSFPEFLQSPIADTVIRRYQRYADYWRQHKAVTLLRYDRAEPGWSTIAADVVATLRLPIDAATVAAIAASTDPVADTLGKDAVTEDITQLDSRLADVLATLGYPAAIERGLGKPHRRPAEGQPPQTPASARTPWGLEAIHEPDPVLFTRLKPNWRVEKDMLGRRLLLESDAVGCRTVVGQPPRGEKTLAVYGCSFTYGLAVNADETFCSLLQGMFPAWRIENYGVYGYGQAHNVIQLERNARWSPPDLVTFCWIEPHLRRNVADIVWMQTLSDHVARSPVGKTPQRPAPRAVLGADGGLAFRSVRMPRHDLVGRDLADFQHDSHYLDLVCLRLFERANAIVTAQGGHFFVTTLAGELSALMQQKLASLGIPILDASLDGEQYRCLTDDPHPNALANRLYAERIRDYLLHH